MTLVQTEPTSIKIGTTDVKKVTVWRVRLPSEYQEVEYIQSSGTQYINTGWTPSSNYCRTVVNMQWVSVGAVDVARGMTNGSSGFNFAVIPNVGEWNPNTYYISAGSSSNIELFNYTLGIDVHIDVTTTNGVYSVDVNSDSDTGSYSGTVAQSTRPMTIFALNENGKINWKTSIRLYSFKIYSDSTTLARDFVPCYRKLDGEIGMYDLVTNTFFTNSGTGTFTKGSDVGGLVEKQVRPSGGGGWQPGANTVAYYKLESDTNDATGTYNLTNSGITFASLGGVVCANFNGSTTTADGNFYSYGTGDFTASVWGQPTSTSQGVWWIIGSNTLVMNSKKGYVEGTSAPTPLNTWTNIVFTITGGKLKIYSNGTLYLDTSFGNNVTGNLKIGMNDGGGFKFRGGLSELIFENIAWTQQEVSDYYNLTKSNYGIS